MDIERYYCPDAPQARHGPLLEVYHHLQQPHKLLQQGTSPAGSEATAFNQQLCHSFNAQPSQQVPNKQGSAASTAASCNAEQLQQCRKAAAGGPKQVAILWGQIQEPAALLQLTELLPSSVLHETGLHVISQEMVPAGYCIAGASQAQDGAGAQHAGSSKSSIRAAQGTEAQAAPGHLPLMGASPDGLIRHSISLTAAALQGLEPLLLDVQRAGTADATQVCLNALLVLGW